MQRISEPDRLKIPTASERRRNRRVALTFQIEVSGVDPAGAAFLDPAVTIDISEDGCQFLFQRKLCPGERLNLGLVNTDFARLTGKKTQPFEVVWVEPGRQGWTIGVKKLLVGNIWPINFPIERKPQS